FFNPLMRHWLSSACAVKNWPSGGPQGRAFFFARIAGVVVSVVRRRRAMVYTGCFTMMIEHCHQNGVTAGSTPARPITTDLVTAARGSADTVRSKAGQAFQSQDP